MGRTWLKIAAAVLGLATALGGMLGALLAGQPLLVTLFGVLLVGIVVFAGLAAVRVRRPVRARRARAWHDASLLGSETVAAPPPSQASGLEAEAQAEARRTPFPADFDVPAILRAARESFIRLQVASLRGRLDELRDVITTDMYETLRADAARRPSDVVTLNANLLEVATEAGRHRASVRFFGLVRRTPGAEAASFEQVWNLVKPADGAGGWMLAGIQQMH